MCKRIKKYRFSLFTAYIKTTSLTHLFKYIKQWKHLIQACLKNDKIYDEKKTVFNI